MEYDFVMSIASSIDNVYNNLSEDGSRRTVAKLDNDNTLSISFRSIVNISRENDLHIQMKHLKKEANDFISARLKSIKSDFKDSCGRALVCKKVNEKDSLETLTVSPHSLMKTLKFNCTYFYEVK
jgi:hypothetical protein